MERKEGKRLKCVRRCFSRRDVRARGERSRDEVLDGFNATGVGGARWVGSVREVNENSSSFSQAPRGARAFPSRGGSHFFKGKKKKQQHRVGGAPASSTALFYCRL